MRRKPVNVFSLSFLDCMFCGFGAVILLYLLINANTLARRDKLHDDLRSDVNRLEQEVLEGTKNLVEIKNSLDVSEEDRVITQGRVRQVLEDVEDRRAKFAELSKDTTAKTENIKDLSASLKSLESGKNRLEGGARRDQGRGEKVRRVVGDGERQYLTGVKVGGKRIVLLVDASASMLGETIVDVLRRRNQSDAVKREAEKWRHALATVNWLTAQFPPDSRYQIYAFNETAKAVKQGTASTWLDAGNGPQLDEVVGALRRTVPAKGTSLFHAFAALKALQPLPDNVFLLTDGLPTRGEDKPWGNTVSPEKRLDHFKRAARKLPPGIPVNVVLFPMEGDAYAPSAYWTLTMTSGGSFMSPSRDWP